VDVYLSRHTGLLEHLAIRPLILLALDFNWLVPRPHVVHELLVRLLGGVQLLELIRIDIRRNLERRESFLAPNHERTADNAVVLDAVHGSTPENVLARAFQTREEAADEVGGHEGLRKLLVVLVVDLPDAVLVELAVLPEPRKGDFACLLVGVFALPVTRQ